MTVHYNSDVPVQYGSWAEYDIMRPWSLADKTADSLAAAFISNCAANNFRNRVGPLPLKGCLLQHFKLQSSLSTSCALCGHSFVLASLATCHAYGPIILLLLAPSPCDPSLLFWFLPCLPVCAGS